MSHIQIPVLPISERDVLEDLRPFFADVLEMLDRKNMPAPVLLFEVCEDDRRRPGEELKMSDAPERMVVFAAAEFRDAVMKALKAVESREPRVPQNPSRRIKLKGNTPLKSVFRQMAEVPITVFSMTDADFREATTFFLRTAFTITELRKELPNVVIESVEGLGETPNATE